MAVGFADGGRKPAVATEYPGRLTLFVFLACLMASCGGLLFGYDVGISGGVTSMDEFLEKFFPHVLRMEEIHTGGANQYCKFNSVLLTSFTSSLYLFALLASFLASTITRKKGRKFSMIVGAIVFFVGAAVNGAAQNVIMLIIGRALLGIGVGLSAQAVPLYLSEVAPTKYRGFLNIGYQLMITVGILVANCINYGTSKMGGQWGWRLSLGLAVVPALIMFMCFILPDTPNSLIERGKNEKAKKILCRIRGTDDISMEYDDLVRASIESKAIEHPWSTFFERKYRPQLLICILIPMFQQLTGINVIMFYAPVLFKTLGFASDASLMSAVITGGINVLATIVSIFAVDKAGRRFLFVEGGIQMFLGQIAVGILIGMKFGTSGVAVIPKEYAMGVVFCICLFVTGFAWSWGPLAWLVPAEISPLEIRSAAQSMNVAVNMLFTFIIAQVFPPMLCKMKFGLFFFFAAFAVLMTAFVVAFVPETKNIPIEEMQSVWKKHWFWSKYIVDCDDDSAANQV